MVDHKRYAVKILEKANTEREGAPGALSRVVGEGAFVRAWERDLRGVGGHVLARSGRLSGGPPGAGARRPPGC